MTETASPSIKIAARCTKCGKDLVLSQHPDCPPLRVEMWLKIIVCNRCGAYLEALRKIDDAIAATCVQLMRPDKAKEPAQMRAFVSGQLERLTRELDRILCKRWVTTSCWSHEFVELLMDKPDKTRMAVRMEESNHRRAREQADMEAVRKRAEDLIPT